MAYRWKFYLLSFCVLFGLIQSIPNSVIGRCEKNNEICMIKSANNVLKYIADGIPLLNIKSIDPIIPNDVEGDSAKFTYKFTNNSILGFRKCEFSHIKLNLDLSTLHFDIKCPSLIIQGNYQVSGELVDLSLKRNGTYKVTTGLYFINFNTEIEKVLGSDGEHHLAIIGYRLAKIHFDEEKFEELHVLTRDAYRAAVFGPLFTYVNRFLETIPLQDLFIVNT